jgi:hypothetical protein
MGSPSVASGLGDSVSGALSGLTGGSSTLDVCVDQGGGNVVFPGSGGNGGGASGVSLGSNFSSPVLVAGGGGGGGLDLLGFVASGGNAGEPVAAAGSNDPANASTTGGGGGNNTTDSGGAAGAGFFEEAAGEGFSAAGPGVGGGQGAAATLYTGAHIGGGAGGGGYYGGGSGGFDMTYNNYPAGGGGGGSDYCVDGGSVSGCSVTSGGGTQLGAGKAAGDAQVTLTYTVVPPPSVTITTPANGATYTYGQVVDANYSCTAGGTLKSCVGTVVSGSAIDTSTVGSGQSFTVTATDTDSQTTTVTNTYNVVAASTSLKAWPQLVLLEPFVGVGNQVVQATLTSGGSPLAGQKISFSDGSTPLCTAVTKSNGVARCTISSIDQALLNRTNQYTATLAGTTDYTGASSTAPAVVFLWF